MPGGVQAQTAGHDWIAGEMAVKEPETGVDIQFRQDLALAIGTALVIDPDDTIQHEHVGRRQLGVAGTEHLPSAALQQLFVTEGFLTHGGRVLGLGPWRKGVRHGDAGDPPGRGVNED